MKLTIESQYGTYSAEVEDDDLNFSDLISKLLVPVCLAQGFSYETMMGQFKNEE